MRDRSGGDEEDVEATMRIICRESNKYLDLAYQSPITVEEGGGIASIEVL